MCFRKSHNELQSIVRPVTLTFPECSVQWHIMQGPDDSPSNIQMIFVTFYCRIHEKQELFDFKEWQSFLHHIFSKTFYWHECANILAIYDSWDLNLYSWVLTSAGSREMSSITLCHESKERQRSALLTFTCTLWWIEILHTSTALLLFKCEQNVQNITKTHLWNMG